MFDFEKVSSSYECYFCVTRHDGRKSSYRKVEHFEAQRVGDEFWFTFFAPTDEVLEGEPTDTTAKADLQFDKILCPYTLIVDANGKFMGIKDFDKSKRSHFNFCKLSPDVYELASFYAKPLSSEKILLGVLKRNVIYNLLFWKDNLPQQELEFPTFPTPKMITIFSFEDGVKEDGHVVFKTDSVYEERDHFLKSGDCTINIRRDADGLPGEISLVANVDRINYGMFKREITLRRL